MADICPRRFPLLRRYLAFILLILLLPAAHSAATVPSGFTDSTIATGLVSPTAMALAPDGRLFVTQQTGAVRVIKNGVLLAQPFLKLTVNSSGERGLLGIAFDPAFATNRYVYVYYTTSTSPIHNRISRFRASIANPDLAEAGELVLLDLNNLSARNHNGGALHFGADGKLYAAAGENSVGSNAQSLSNLLGKILRINKDGTIPGDNPFYGTATGNNRAIWALGLRNPYTFSFQPGTGRMFINDVGEVTWEETNLGSAGSNYGWPTSEGPLNCTDPGFTCPRYAYDHSQGCAITGGTFYNPANQTFPAGYSGKYFFADYCGNWIKLIDPNAPPANNAAATFATNISAPVDLHVANDGSLYYLARGAGVVGRIQYNASLPAAITQQPTGRTVTVGGTAIFTVSASGSQPISYQWQRNYADIVGATSPTLTLSNVQLSANGAQFRCVVTNQFGSDISNDAILTVTTNTAPEGTITQPTIGTHYNAGQTTAYAGTATDNEDASIPASNFTWQVDFHHDTHVHPFVQPLSGVKSGSFQIPNNGETATNVWYRIYLTVKDSGGLTHTTYRDIIPNTATLTLTSSPSGLPFTLDAQPVTAPYSFDSVVGMRRMIGAASTRSANGITYYFASWSDGGAINHTFPTPAADTTYTATYSSAAVNGNGLTGKYFSNKSLTGASLTRIDPTVNFTWHYGSPLAGVPSNLFSVRWTGMVQPQFSGNTRFFASANDGVRLWVNNVLLVNRWYNNAGEGSATINLVGGQKYAIKMEYYENLGPASARLSWSHPSKTKQVIPKARLYSQ